MSIAAYAEKSWRWITVTLGLAGLALGLHAQPANELEAGFRLPPASAKPQTLWFWMNGNVSRDGITRDLEAMQRVGIGGAMMFDGGIYLPEGPAKYLDPAWRGLITVPADFLAADKRVVLDLGRVEVVAEVIVNGKRLGPMWKEPFWIDLTDAVRAGANELEVRVTNLWANRLIGDEHAPAEYDYGARGDHGILQLPTWYSSGEPKPGSERVTFTTWKFYSKEEPLLESGLLGPVRLLNPVRQVLAP